MSMPQSQSGAQGKERRTQRRIELRIPVELTLPGRAGTIRAVTRDLSWGGALVELLEPLPPEVDLLLISLPWRKGKSIHAQAQVLRRQPIDDKDWLIALRFTSLSPRSQSRLERLLEMLLRHDTKAAGADVPLFRELEVVVSDAEELRQILLQLLEGRYTATVFESYQVGQSIRLTITPNLDLPDLHLRARVVGVEKLDLKGYDWTELYNLSLVLEHPKQTIRDFVDLVMRQLAESGVSTYSSLTGAPDWLRSVVTAINRSPVDGESASVPGSSGRPQELSYLEAHFPQVIERLKAAWGDVEGFDEMFSRLTISKPDQAEGWPMPAWQELEFLQEVHDLAYGVPKRRQGVLKGGR